MKILFFSVFVSTKFDAIVSLTSIVKSKQEIGKAMRCYDGLKAFNLELKARKHEVLLFPFSDKLIDKMYFFLFINFSGVGNILV